MKNILFAILILLGIVNATQAQDCKPYASQEEVHRQLKTETVHQPIGNGVYDAWAIQYGVFLNPPTKLPKGVIAYPLLMVHEGQMKNMWIAFWESYYFRKEDAQVIVYALKQAGTCQPFLKQIKVGI